MTSSFVLLLVLAQATAARPTPVPTATPAAVPVSASKLSGGFGQKPAAPGKAKVVVTDATLAPTGTSRGAFSVAGEPIAPPLMMPVLGTSPEETAAAQKRMDAAVRDGIWVLNNTRHNWQIWESARVEWEAAAENCRKTVGCVPHYKPDWAFPTVRR